MALLVEDRTVTDASRMQKNMAERENRVSQGECQPGQINGRDNIKIENLGDKNKRSSTRLNFAWRHTEKNQVNLCRGGCA